MNLCGIISERFLNVQILTVRLVTHIGFENQTKNLWTFVLIKIREGAHVHGESVVVFDHFWNRDEMRLQEFLSF